MLFNPLTKLNKSPSTEVSSDYRSEFLVVLGCAYIPGLILLLAISLGVSSVHWFTLFVVGVLIAFSIATNYLYKSIMKKLQHREGFVNSFYAVNSKLYLTLMPSGYAQAHLHNIFEKNLKGPLWKLSLVVALGFLIAGTVWR